MPNPLNEHTGDKPAVDEASFRYEGWRIVVVCFFVATFGWALGFYGQSVYLAELQRVHGWPSSLIATATSCFYLFGALQVAFVSEAMRALGARNILILGVVCMAVATILLGRITEPWQLFAVYALLATGWAGTSLGAITNTLGLWFDKRRGMAISLSLNGASFGGIIGVPLLVVAIGKLGFTEATLTVALVGAALLLPLIYLLVGKPPLRALPVAASINNAPTQGIRAQALRDPAFLTLTTAFALTLFAQVGVIVHLISYLDPVVGREKAAIAVSVMTAMAVIGRVLVSTVIDRMNQRVASAASFASQALALIIVINSREPAFILFACALFGFSVGNLITLPALILQREFNPRSFGVLVTLLTAITQIAYSFGPGIVGWLREFSGGYATPFYFCIALQLLAALLVLKGRAAPPHPAV